MSLLKLLFADIDNQSSGEEASAAENRIFSKAAVKSHDSSTRSLEHVKSLPKSPKTFDNIVKEETIDASLEGTKSYSKSISQPSEYTSSKPQSMETFEEPAKELSFAIKPESLRKEASASRPLSHNSVIAPKQQRLFKLPVITERYHGTGCAMEISVLEKHDSLCVYKKDDTEGRSIDDKVGSYDCIGRLVFKTCNADETQSKDLETSGSVGSGDKFLTDKESSVKKTLQEQALEELHQTISEAKAISQALLSVQSLSKQLNKSQVLAPRTEKVVMSPTSVKSQASHLIIEPSNEKVTASPIKNQSAGSANITSPATHSSIERPTSRQLSSNLKSLSIATTENTQKSGSANVQSLSAIQEQEVIEPTAVAENVKPLQSNPWHRHEQIMYATVETRRNKGFKTDFVKKPLENFSVSTNEHIKKKSSLKKFFPDYTDGGNQTDPILNNVVTHRLSQNTVDSLSSLSTSEERKKPSFFSSLFMKKDTLKSSCSSTKKSYKK